MSHRRWIISSHQINGTGCIHDCYSSFHPPPHPPHLPATAFIAVVSAAFAVLFLVLTYYIVLFRRRRADRVDSGDHLPSDPDGADADYHVWRIRTDGLDESTINSISVKPYIAGGGATADCSVCLGEFRDGELVRLLPACDHAFHVSCIDTWLRAHINCPLCRARIIGHSDSGGGSLGSVASDGDALVSDRRVSGDLEDDEGREIRTVDVTDSSMDCAEHSILPASRDLPGNGLQLLCQSNSMDSLPESDLVVRLDRDGSSQEEKKDQELYHSDDGMVNEKKGKVGSSSKGDEQQKCLAEIGGDSTSVSGGVFFFSRYGRARSSSVLPL